MKALKIFNAIAISIPILLAFLGVFDHELILLSIASLMITGLIQTLVAAAFWIKEGYNLHIIFYFAGSALFFLFAFGIHKFDLDDVFKFLFWIMPACLCVYLTWILHTFEEDLTEV